MSSYTKLKNGQWGVRVEGRATYKVTRYNDGEVIGKAVLTAEQFAHYEAMSQQPEGTIRLGALPHSYYDLKAEYQDTGENVTVWLD